MLEQLTPKETVGFVARFRINSEEYSESIWDTYARLWCNRMMNNSRWKIYKNNKFFEDSSNIKKIWFISEGINGLSNRLSQKNFENIRITGYHV